MRPPWVLLRSAPGRRPGPRRLAAAAGTGLINLFIVTSGLSLLLLMFAGIMPGGLGSIYGPMVGSLLIVVLPVRPQGILGRWERVG